MHSVLAELKNDDLIDESDFRTVMDVFERQQTGNYSSPFTVECAHSVLLVSKDGLLKVSSKTDSDE